MSDSPVTPKVDRRTFLNGQWPERVNKPASTAVEIASILVQARPEHLDAVTAAIEAMPGSEIYSRSLQGKLVVVIEAGGVGAIGSALNAISSMQHVLNAALVFQGTDEG